MKRILRLTSLALPLVVAVALMATTTAPAQAGPAAGVSARSAHSTAPPPVSRATEAHPGSTGTPSAGEHVKQFRPHVSYMGHDYCGGWIHGPAWCLTFNKAEAGYISAVSLATATAFICGATALVTCGIAAAIAAAIQRYVDHNGVCPSSHPKMRVEYFPHPGLVSCD